MGIWDKCPKCGGYIDHDIAETYRSKKCICYCLENKRHKELIESIKSLKENTEVPDFAPSFKTLARQMRINCDILKKEFSEHVDSEILRFKREVDVRKM